jgi:glycosyltransferase involved in cell wall biosynthesis
MTGSASGPWLSVLIPTFNGEAYLKEALESVAAQSRDGLEVIAVDDGSTDATLSILESFSPRLRIRIEPRPHSGNWVAGSNLALRLARGEFVSIFHQDDGWLPGRLSAMRGILSEAPDLVAALHPVEMRGPDGEFLGSWRCPLPPFPAVLDRRLLASRLLVQNFVSVGAPLFRRLAALEAGGLDESLWYAADWDLWLKLASKGSFGYFPEPLGYFRIHRSSQTWAGRTDPGEIRRQLELVLSRYLKAFREGEPREFDRVGRVARFSLEVNIFLFERFGIRARMFPRLFWRFLALGWEGWATFLRDSRIAERVLARARLAAERRRDRPSPGGRRA